MKLHIQPKIKISDHDERIDNGRQARIEHFESIQMDSFLKAIGDELVMDQAAALSLIHYAALNGLNDYLQIVYNDQIQWAILRRVFAPGWWPIERCHWLSEQYKAIRESSILFADRYYPKHVRAIERRNAINHLARMLFYNDPANRFFGTVQ